MADRSAVATLPTVPFGPHRITRLIVGGNPFSGHSHTSAELNQELIDIKPTDAVVVGVFQKRGNQVAQNADIVRGICGA